MQLGYVDREIWNTKPSIKVIYYYYKDKKNGAIYAHLKFRTWFF